MISHHPSDETLMRLAAGELEAGPSLVVAAHIAQCTACRKIMRALETVGGTALETVDAVAMAGDATGEVAALLADPDAVAATREVGWGAAASAQANRAVGVSAPIRTGDAPGVRAGARTGATTGWARIAAAWRNGPQNGRPSAWAGLPLPSPLLAYEATPWRIVAPGVHWARVPMPDAPDQKVLLLKAAPGTGLPAHSHEGVEYTCILQGSFQDGGRVMRVGDVSECDADEYHQPRVNSEMACVCVLAVTGGLVMDSWLARLAQRIVGL